VLVNAEDASVRQNRLALLGDIRGLVESVADLSKITQ
jgi:glycyl-tRNA synthetase beta subunit